MNLNEFQAGKADAATPTIFEAILAASIKILLSTLFILFSAASACVAAEAEAIYVYRTVLIRPKAPITIDGDLSDWDGINVKVQAMDNLIVGVVGLYEPSDKADFSGTFRCAADPDNIYVAVEIRDDKRVFGEHEFGYYWKVMW